MNRPSRTAAFSVLPVPALVVCLAMLAVTPQGARPAADGPADAGLVEWLAIDRMVEEQKLEEASRAVAARLAAARARRDEEEWTRALVKEVQLRTGLHGYEKAVRFLREEERPKGMRQRAVLDLFYAQSLVNYTHAHGWQIRGRERVESKGPIDLGTWTLDQIAEEALRAYERVWAEREALGGEPLGWLGEYVIPGNYPDAVRGTVRDAVTYLLVEFLADSSLWRPEQSSEVDRLSLRSLLETGGPAPALTDASVHPLAKIAGFLRDLEDWHRAAGRREAQLEARLERFRRLRVSFTESDERAVLAAQLERDLGPFRDVPWWSAGMADLATAFRAGEGPSAIVDARRVAEAGREAYPDSIGGRQCRAIVEDIDAPDFQVASMMLDGARRRSLQVTHRNMARLHFRAWRSDVLRSVEGARDYDLLGVHRDADETTRRVPDLEWSVELPPTPDLRSHVTYVTPPLERPGLYTIGASARSDFAREENRILAVRMIVSDLVLVSRPRPGGLEVMAVEGAGGAPLAGVEVILFRMDWRKGHTRLRSGTTDASGAVALDAGEERGQCFVVGRRGDHVAVDTQQTWLAPASQERRAHTSFVYTDRSVYRPLQKLSFKVVAYEGGGARFETRPNASLSVSLVDRNNQVVETRQVTTNSFGSASGEFTVPAGRVLGRWTVRASDGGQAGVRVEEYKRPTFEARLLDPESALRLNRPARLRGEARYYFGLPVTSGGVRWRVTREPVWPWWWGAWSEPSGRTANRTETIATGHATLDEQGHFQLDFTPEADEREPKEVSYRYAVTADVTDEGGETRSSSRSFRLGLVAIEAHVETETAFLREGVDAEVVVRRTDLDGVARSGEGRFRLFALEQPKETLTPAEQPARRPAAPDGYRTAGDGLRPRWAHGYASEAVLASWPEGHERASGSVVHDGTGVGKLRLRGLPAGAYRLRYETKDGFGAAFTTSKDIVVAGRDSTPLRLPALLLAERPSVRVGETARLLVASGLPDGRLVIDIEKEGRRVSRQVLVAGRDRSLIEVPVGEADRGGFGVTLTLVRDHQLVTLTQLVQVPWEDRELTLEFATFRDRLRPGGRETWRVTVRGADGRPPETGASELLAYMYDRSLDVFAPHQPPSVLGVYPGRARTGWVRASLGQAPGHHLVENRFGVVMGPAPLQGSRLVFYEAYGVGGMGVRTRQKSEHVLEMSRTALAPVPAARAAGLGLEGGVPGGTVGGIVGGIQGAAPPDADSLSAVSRELTAPAPSAPVEMRTEFSETAFWQPHLLTGADGSAAIEFTVPDSVTAWNVWVHALTRDLRGGSAQRQARSVKDLMVRPYVPRFLREGDRAELKVVVNNASAAELSGSLSLDVIDAESERSLAREFGLAPLQPRAFSVKAGGGTDLSYAVTVPPQVGQVAFRVTARAGDSSDGELRPIPILPGRMHLAESRFVALRPGKPRTMSFADPARADDATRIDEQMVVTVDAQLFYSVLQAVPYLLDYPYECTEQTLNRFLSTAILHSLFAQQPAVAKMAAQMAQRETRLETWNENDPNRKMALEETPWLQEARGGADPGAPLLKVLDPRIASAQREASLARLRKAQTSLGAFPWWPGGPPSPYMTLYLLHGFAKGLEFGVETPKDMTTRAWAYVHRHYLDEVVRQMRKDDCCWEFVTFVNYVLSAYPDASWTGGVFTDTERREMLEFSFRHWKEHAPYLKGYLALTLLRSGRRGDAQRVFESVMDSAKTDEDLGTYWAPEDRAWLWYNDTIETHAFALRVLGELDPTDPRREGLVQWLFLNKKLSHWKSTRATAEVVYSLAHYLRGTGALGAREAVRVDAGPQKAEFVFEPDRYTGRANRLVIPGPKVDPQAMSAIRVEKDGPGLAFASATWHFSSEKLPQEERGDLLSVSRRYFRREHRGKEWVLAPLAEGASLAPGDEVEVQLSVRAKHAAEYVHLRDPRGAGLEPGVAVSRFRWDLGIAWYEEVRDSGTNFFFEQLPAGEYTLKYRLRAAMAGTFRVSPATLQSMYAPEFTAYSKGDVIRVGGPSARGAQAESGAAWGARRAGR